MRWVSDFLMNDEFLYVRSCNVNGIVFGLEIDVKDLGIPAYQWFIASCHAGHFLICV